VKEMEDIGVEQKKPLLLQTENNDEGSELK
jgi:hypothetical protein